MFIPPDKVEWKLVKYLRQGQSRNYDYELLLNEPLASWDVWDYWEVERVKSMEAHLKEGDILFDVGTETGWCNLVYAKIVGPENMVLIEPSPEFWPNIKSLWQKNFGDVFPLSCYAGFFSDKTNSLEVLPKHTFPSLSDGPLIDKNSYKNISENAHEVPQITIDKYVELTGIVPDAITVDVEGAELLVLKGAEKLLTEKSIHLWVSEHDDLALKGYNTNPDDVANFMQGLGYSREVLGTNHERHVYYHK